VTLGEVMALC